MDRLPSFGTDAEHRTLGVGETLCVEGGTDTDVFQIVSGMLDVERKTDEGTMVVSTVGPGDLVGEVVNALGGRRTATVRASEPTEVLSLSQEAFSRWLEAHPDAATAISAEARQRSNRSRASAVLANLFGLENQEVVEAIVNEIEWITLRPGDLLFEQGEPADAAYLLLAGRLSIESRDEDGDLTLDIEIGRGEIVGEMGILEDSPRSASVRAIRETTLATISRNAFEAITAAYPRLMVKVFHTIIDRLMHRHEPDTRARVVCVASTIPDRPTDLLAPFVQAVEPFGSTLHLSSTNLGRFVRDVAGPGGMARAAAFLHEADVAHNYVLLESDLELTDWSINSARQSDRFVLISSASPDEQERDAMRGFLDVLSDSQRSSAWIARIHPETTDRPTLSAEYADEFSVGEVHNLRYGSPSHLGRLGRLATGNGRGVVLGGGGAKGFAHIGALRALREAGLDYDRVGGASMGAVIGALAARDESWEVTLETVEDAFSKKLLDYTLPLVSLFRAEKSARGLDKMFGTWNVEDLWIPFYCVSTNITQSKLSIHRSGDLRRVLRASTAIPVALPPVPIDGDLHVDGGVLDNIPVTPMHQDSSIGTLIAVDVSPPAGPAASEDFGLSVSGIEALKRRFRRGAALPDIGTTLMSSMLIGSTKSKNEWATGGVVDLYIDLDVSDVGLMQFDNHAAVAERGFEGAKAAIAEWLNR